MTNPATAKPAMTPAELARRVFRRHQKLHPMEHYTGILSMQAMARLALATGSAEDLDLAREALLPFVRGERQVKGNFVVYDSGGNGAALLHFHGKLPEATDALEEKAAAQAAAPRDPNGIFCRPSERERPQNKIWIDTAFAVTPFFLHCGLAFDRDDYVEDAVHQTLKMREIFLDDACGLVHQGLNFNGPGVISQDHWSRGNGWGLLALAELVDGLPESHPRRKECEAAFVDWLKACLELQDPEEGLWRQEMTLTGKRDTYIETSGSGLILFALGVAIERGLMPEARPRWEKGLAGLLEYVRISDGSVYHCCTGCCCPEDGSIAAFIKKPPVFNDNHAFGPVILVLAQAVRLGVNRLPDSVRS